MFSLKLRTLRQQQESAEQRALLRPPSVAEMWWVTAACLWFFAGLITDGWAHNHVPELESFFTPWHAAFYSGYAMSALVFLCIVLRHRRRTGLPFLKSIPQGYGYALLGVPLFLFGGAGDMVWHIVFGIEADIEALLSPTHLVLALSMFLMVSANLRAWFRIPPQIGRPHLLSQLPMLLSLVMSLSLVWFMVQFSHFAIVRAGGLPPARELVSLTHNAAITGYLFHTVVLMGALLLVLRRGRTAPGALTVVLMLSMLPMAVMLDAEILMPAAVLTGILADLMAQRLHPFEQHRREVRAFSFLVPAVLFTLYFLTVSLHEGIWWSVHLWTGSVFMPALASLLLSALVLPPAEDA